jgi:hypothetical protein
LKNTNLTGAGGEAVSAKLAEMWAALESHKPAPEYAEAWATMLKERTIASVDAVWGWVPKKSAVDDALWHVWETVDALREVEIFADRAIAAIKRHRRVKP